MQLVQGDDRLIHFNPRPPRGGRPLGVIETAEQDGISIHALREEGDSSDLWSKRQNAYFNPRPPRGGRLLTILILYTDRC